MGIFDELLSLGGDGPKPISGPWIHYDGGPVTLYFEQILNPDGPSPTYLFRSKPDDQRYYFDDKTNLVFRMHSFAWELKRAGGHLLTIPHAFIELQDGDPFVWVDGRHWEDAPWWGVRYLDAKGAMLGDMIIGHDEAVLPHPLYHEATKLIFPRVERPGRVEIDVQTAPLRPSKIQPELIKTVSLDFGVGRAFFGK